jgi:hypothetical protein
MSEFVNSDNIACHKQRSSVRRFRDQRVLTATSHERLRRRSMSVMDALHISHGGTVSKSRKPLSSPLLATTGV